MIPLYAWALMAPALHMPGIFADHMVLQRDQTIPIFGRATPGQTISVEFAGRHASTTVRQNGTWQVNFRPHSAGGPYTLKVTGDGEATFTDVMVGEVWVASGQSNMEWPILQQNDVDVAQSEASPTLRMFTVGRNAADMRAEDVKGSWVPASSDTVGAFSAIGFWFGNDLRKWLNVPIGIINTSWGGTPGESWLRRERILSDPDLDYIARDYLNNLPSFKDRKAKYDQAIAAWNSIVYTKDEKNAGMLEGWYSPSYLPTDWHAVTLPNLLEVTEGEDMDGSVWYRRTVDLPAEWAGREMTVELGPIDDFDDTYFNGRRIGGIDQRWEYWNSIPRRYTVPPALVRSGQNTLAVRVFDQMGRGGFTGAASQMRVYPTDGAGAPITLAGTWVSKIERRVKPPSPELLASQPQAPYGPGHPWGPGSLWNGMVSPLIPYGIRGVIWYQGESNTDRAEEYRQMFPLLIDDWRGQWGQGDFPFLFVQLSGYTARVTDPGPSPWAELREAQANTRFLPNTGMAVSLDLGDPNDIHPRTKLEIGRRLSLVALANVYKVDVADKGPSFRVMLPEGDGVRLEFKNAAGLRTVDGKAPTGFAVAGADQKFVWAEAHIEGDSIVLTPPAGLKVVAVRYAWANNPDVNLYNADGLPMEPFRTDRWPGITVGKRRTP